PPVLLVNHAAHIYWTGSSAPDLVVNCRGSQLEEHWTKLHRGVTNCATIPIPLVENENSPLAGEERRPQAREAIGIPEESILIMTWGVSHKYKQRGETDFRKACREILEAVPQAFVAAAGVVEDERWRTASTLSGFRLRALGSLPQREIALLH